jgi:hypothetical protein
MEEMFESSSLIFQQKVCSINEEINLKTVDLNE